MGWVFNLVLLRTPLAFSLKNSCWGCVMIYPMIFASLCSLIVV